MASTVSDLITSVNEDVHTGSFSQSVILRYLNEALNLVSSLLLLPDLATSGTVTTSGSSPTVAMPSNYHKYLHAATSAATTLAVKVDSSFARFLRYYPSLNQTGTIERCALRRGGTTLYYQPMAGDTLTLYYYRRPLVLVASGAVENVSTTSIDGIPLGFEDPVIAGYAKWKLWKKVEQDKARKSNNSGMYKEEHEIGLAALADYIGPVDSEALYVSDELYSDDMIGGAPWLIPG